jgi:hypothetical protein
MSNKCVEEILSKEKFIKNYIEEKNAEICAYERTPILPTSTDRYFLLEVKVIYRRSYWIYSSDQKICNSKLFVTNMKNTIREVKLEIFKYFRPLIP